MIARLRAALNSSRVTIGGAAIALGFLPFIGGRGPLDLWATAHLDGMSAVARAFVDGAATVGLVVVWPAIIAAALGRSPLRSSASDTLHDLPPSA